MPNKGNRKNKKKFFCPYCRERLWRVDTQYCSRCTDSDVIKTVTSNAAEARSSGISAPQEKAERLASQETCGEQNCWIEMFFCGEHGQLWLLLAQQPDETIVIQSVVNVDEQQLKATPCKSHPCHRKRESDRRPHSEDLSQS